MNPMIGAALIGGGFPLVGGLLGSSSAAQQNAEERAWQEHMAGTQYQRAVKDMRAAGLNPAMLYGRGMLSAGVSGGARFEEGAGIREGLRGAGAGIMSSMLMKAQINDVNSAVALKLQQKEQIAQDMHIQLNDWMGKNPTVGGVQDLTSWGRLQRHMLEQQTAEVIARIKNVDQQTAESIARKGILEVEKRIKEYGVPEAKAWHDYWNAVGMGGVAIEVGGDVIKGIGGLLNIFKRAKPGATHGGASSARQIRRMR